MIPSRLQSYPAMTDSGVAWLGEVPTHWRVLPNRAVYQEVARRNHPTEKMLSVTIKQGVIDQRTLLSTGGKKDGSRLDKSAYKLVHPGDIVYNKMRAWQGAIAASERRGIVSPAYVVQRPNDGADPRYLHYLLRIPAFASEAERWSYGITSDMWSLRPEHFKLIYGCLPTSAEQKAVVQFLDYADQHIRRYIRAKEGLIELLAEQQQALVHQAVTGQIDVRTGQPYPAYKDSGVDWLGTVPEHWNVLRFGRLVSLVVGFPFKSQGFTEGGDGIRLLRGINVAPGELRWQEVVRWPVWDTDGLTEYRMQVGDIVVGMDRPIIGSGIRVAVVSPSDIPALLLQRVARIRVGGSLARDFAVVLLSGKGFRDYLAPIFTGISVPHLSPGQIKDFRVAVPGLVEQRAIIKQVKSRTEAVQSAIAGVAKQIRFLKEYRTRLIADVVTGKLDVREAVASLPKIDPRTANDPRDEAGARFEGHRQGTELYLQSVHP